MAGKEIEKAILEFIRSPMNTLKNADDEAAWGTPLIGYSSGADPLYDFYKRDIGEFYMKPMEFFSEDQIAPDDLTVVSWVLPQTEATKADHRAETHFPSERWARSRTFGEEVNDDLRRHVIEVLAGMGIKSVAPSISPEFETFKDVRYVFASSWSERHAAYAAGLGTFGLSDGLITPVGKAIRVGSVIAATRIEPTPRTYEDHHAYCLFYQNGTCGDCIERCPIGAITEKGHDKVLCRNYGRMCSRYIERHYGFKGTGCGFCQTGVACESGIPGGI